MAFEPIRRLLPQAVRSAGIETQVDAARIIATASSVLEALWGQEKASWVRPVSFHGGILKFAARAPVAGQELRAWDVRLRNEINRRVGGQRVKNLHVSFGGEES